jgi:aldehyde:ferredoxin oxidoreductase
MALGFAVGARGADHNRSGAYDVDFSDKVDRRQRDARLGIATPIDTEDKAALMDSLILCKFLRRVLEDFYGERPVCCARFTGWDVTADELTRTAKRIVSAKRQVNLLAGWTRARRYAPRSFLQLTTAQRSRGFAQSRASAGTRCGIPSSTRLVAPLP